MRVSVVTSVSPLAVSSTRKLMAPSAKPGACSALKSSGVGSFFGRHTLGAPTSVPRTISRSGSSARSIKLVRVATSSKGIFSGAFKMPSGPRRPIRRIHVSVRNSVISFAGTSRIAWYTRSRGALTRMLSNSANWYARTKSSRIVVRAAIFFSAAGKFTPIKKSTTPHNNTTMPCGRPAIPMNFSGRIRETPPRSIAARAAYTRIVPMRFMRGDFELQFEQFAQAPDLGAADGNFGLLLVVHFQHVAGFEPRHHFLDVMNVHQVRAVRAPERFGVEGGLHLFECAVFGSSLVVL